MVISASLLLEIAWTIFLQVRIKEDDAQNPDTVSFIAVFSAGTAAASGCTIKIIIIVSVTQITIQSSSLATLCASHQPPVLLMLVG